MTVVTQIFAVLAGLIHVGIFVLESVVFTNPKVSRTFLGKTPVTPELRLFAFNQGFYNLFLGLGAIGGVLFDSKPITLFCCACMLAAGLVLIASNRRLWRGAMGQVIPAGIALLAALF
jgi:putative membrane protein